MKKRTKKAADTASTARDTLPEKIHFHYIKSNFFRVIHVDGVHGGITPTAQIQMALFSDRRPIPQQTVHRVTPELTVGEEVREERVERQGIVREVEIESIMALATARTLLKWLEDKIDTLERLSADAESSEKLTRRRVKK